MLSHKTPRFGPTVDAYQAKAGSSSFAGTRSNPEYNMGFVRTANRINVALSRAIQANVAYKATQVGIPVWRFDGGA